MPHRWWRRGEGEGRSDGEHGERPGAESHEGRSSVPEGVGPHNSNTPAAINALSSSSRPGGVGGKEEGGEGSNASSSSCAGATHPVGEGARPRTTRALVDDDATAAATWQVAEGGLPSEVPGDMVLEVEPGEGLGTAIPCAPSRDRCARRAALREALRGASRIGTGGEIAGGRDGVVELEGIVVAGSNTTTTAPAAMVGDKDADEEDQARYCRICMESVQTANLDDGSAVQLGCACTSGYIHTACATGYVRAKRGDLVCEICLEEMTALEDVTTKLQAERRNYLQARSALMAINGGENSAADVEDPRLWRPGWGSQNPLAWLLWIVSRPFALLWLLVRLIFFCRVTLLLAAFLGVIVYFLFKMEGQSSANRSDAWGNSSSEGSMGGSPVVHTTDVGRGGHGLSAGFGG